MWDTLTLSGIKVLSLALSLIHPLFLPTHPSHPSFLPQALPFICLSLADFTASISRPLSISLSHYSLSSVSHCLLLFPSAVPLALSGSPLHFSICHSILSFTFILSFPLRDICLFIHLSLSLSFTSPLPHPLHITAHLFFVPLWTCPSPSSLPPSALSSRCLATFYLRLSLLLHPLTCAQQVIFIWWRMSMCLISFKLKVLKLLYVTFLHQSCCTSSLRNSRFSSNQAKKCRQICIKLFLIWIDLSQYKVQCLYCSGWKGSRGQVLQFHVFQSILCTLLYFLVLPLCSVNKTSTLQIKCSILVCSTLVLGNVSYIWHLLTALKFCLQ